MEQTEMKRELSMRLKIEIAYDKCARKFNQGSTYRIFFLLVLKVYVSKYLTMVKMRQNF